MYVQSMYMKCITKLILDLAQKSDFKPRGKSVSFRYYSCSQTDHIRIPGIFPR
jgi:hypothetical protein